ncbi:MAG: hydantoinase/oxoprolinase family protein, partial [Actinobacteria bacterium]|nr:hydantoinase/oxoprolinase family protein [Actinomycetota bacterium]NIS36056.1 hydantoinase/oxoprolinase family protein [Actinomycetota bacterium]NIU70631.1 hydantoinase/oxoprolinase family protein [Actinomycetota bacterium]NIW32534.1 hydantoinase/oxoprolinase family protein [Actinomycetota bacterium]
MRQDYVRTVNAPLASVDMEEVHAIYREQVADGREMIERQGVEVESITVLHTADLQFQGQSHLLTVPVASGEVDR